MNRDYKYRFIAKMDIPRPNKYCIVYLGSLSKDGYGIFGINKKSYPAHRISYELFVGKIPKNMMVLHKCDNPKCVAPQHLFLGTHLDNMKDMVAKKRNASNKGEKHGCSKLLEKDVIKIKKLLDKGIKRRIIAEMFKISSATVYDIKYKRSWKHLK